MCPLNLPIATHTPTSARVPCSRDRGDPLGRPACLEAAQGARGVGGTATRRVHAAHRLVALQCLHGGAEGLRTTCADGGKSAAHAAFPEGIATSAAPLPRLSKDGRPRCCLATVGHSIQLPALGFR